MNALYYGLVVLHLLSWAFVFGSALVNLKKPRIPAGAVHAILTALVTGVLMVGMASSKIAGLTAHEPDNTKMGVKLVVVLVATGMILYGNKKPRVVTRGYLLGVVGLIVLNVAIAVLWGRV